jgi:hypothetical protein
VPQRQGNGEGEAAVRQHPLQGHNTAQQGTAAVQALQPSHTHIGRRQACLTPPRHTIVDKLRSAWQPLRRTPIQTAGTSIANGAAGYHLGTLTKQQKQKPGLQESVTRCYSRTLLNKMTPMLMLIHMMT